VQLDHLLWGGLDLEAELDRVERLTGVRAAIGGRHPGEGTRNALLRLGPSAYLELMAPDPDQPPPAHPRWLGLDALTEPRLVGWAAKATDLEQRRAAALAAGVPLGEVRAGGRQTSGGEVLSWRLTYPDVSLDGGLVPFLIDWGESRHPARTAPGGIELVELHGEHPEPAVMAARLDRIGIALRVVAGSRPALVATLDTPRGRIELR
jgi:glyoxalase-like protein